MASPHPGTLVFGGLIIWGIFRRIRRNIGRQKLRPARIIFSMVIFSVFSVLFIGLGLKMQQPALLEAIGGGLILGAALGFVGLRLTRFETTDEGHFYTPNTHIGIALVILVAGRILYSLWVQSNTDADAASNNNPASALHPLTLLFFGLLAGYYLVYYIGLFVHTHDKKPPLPPAA
jgi:hypothetical protein